MWYIPHIHSTPSAIYMYRVTVKKLECHFVLVRYILGYGFTGAENCACVRVYLCEYTYIQFGVIYTYTKPCVHLNYVASSSSSSSVQQPQFKRMRARCTRKMEKNEHRPMWKCVRVTCCRSGCVYGLLSKVFFVRSAYIRLIRAQK